MADRTAELIVDSPLQRRTYPAAELIRRHPPVLRNENKQALFAIACPADAVHSGQLEYSRWPELPLPPPGRLDPVGVARLVAIRDGFYDYRPILDPAVGVEWHVNFADPNLFYAYGSALFAQDEIQVAEHPILGSLREALVAQGWPTTTIENGRPTPVLVMGAERRIRIQTAPTSATGGPSWLYGMAFARATADAVREATTRIDPPTISNILAIVAPFGGHGRYQREQIGLAIATAYSAFRAAVLESRRTAGPDALVAIHSGFWGCGAFGGNRILTVALQAIAAEMAGLARLVVHAVNPNGMRDLNAALSVLSRESKGAAETREIIGRIEALDFKWGVSDGN